VFSVLSRLPTPGRRSPSAGQRLLQHNFPSSRCWSAGAAAGLFDELPALVITGGAIYDALVAATARTHNVDLARRDLRAAGVYRALEARIRLVG
jgi:toxin FitB